MSVESSFPGPCGDGGVGCPPEYFSCCPSGMECCDPFTCVTSGIVENPCAFINTSNYYTLVLTCDSGNGHTDLVDGPYLALSNLRTDADNNCLVDIIVSGTIYDSMFSLDPQVSIIGEAKVDGYGDPSGNYSPPECDWFNLYGGIAYTVSNTGLPKTIIGSGTKIISDNISYCLWATDHPSDPMGMYLPASGYIRAKFLLDGILSLYTNTERVPVNCIDVPPPTGTGIVVSSIVLSPETFTNNLRNFNVTFTSNINCGNSFEYRTNDPANTGWIDKPSVSKSNCFTAVESLPVPSSVTEVCFRFYDNKPYYSNEICVPVTPPPPPPLPPTPPCVNTLAGARLEAKYSDTYGPCPGGHRCNRATFTFSINDVILTPSGWGENSDKLNLNNLDGPCDLGPPPQELGIHWSGAALPGSGDRAQVFMVPENVPTKFIQYLDSSGNLISGEGYEFKIECANNAGCVSGPCYYWDGPGPEPCHWISYDVPCDYPQVQCGEPLAMPTASGSGCSILVHGICNDPTGDYYCTLPSGSDGQPTMMYCRENFINTCQGGQSWPGSGYVACGCHMGIVWLEAFKSGVSIFSECFPNDVLSYVVADPNCAQCSGCNQSFKDENENCLVQFSIAQVSGVDPYWGSEPSLVLVGSLAASWWIDPLLAGSSTCPLNNYIPGSGLHIATFKQWYSTYEHCSNFYNVPAEDFEIPSLAQEVNVYLKCLNDQYLVDVISRSRDCNNTHKTYEWRNIRVSSSALCLPDGAVVLGDPTNIIDEGAITTPFVPNLLFSPIT